MKITRRFTCCILAGVTAMLLCPVLSAEQTDAAQPSTNYESQAREVMAYFQQTFYDPDKGLYVKSTTDRTPDYVWREAAAFSALVGATRHEPRTYGPIMSHFFHALDAYWDTKAPVPGYEPAPTRGNGHDKYYDDNAWLVITFAEAYQLTNDRAYLTRARETARFVASGWDDQLGGGIWWHQLHKDGTKNACSNGPAAVGYLALARLGPRDEADQWLTAAGKVVDWTNAKLQAPDGLFEDRVIVATGEIKKGKLTYNAALMLRACLGLYRATGKVEYLNEAERIGKAAESLTDKQTGVYRDALRYSQFMVEADLDLYRATGQPQYLRRVRSNANAYYLSWHAHPPPDMMSNAATARILWLLADTETEKGRAFWKAAENVSGPSPLQPSSDGPR